MDYNKLMSYIFGTTDIEYVVAGAIFMLFGAAVSLGMRVRKGILQNPQSPDKFSIKFLIKDKGIAFIHSLMYSAIALRFSSELIGEENTLFVATVLGYLSYRIANVIDKAINNYIKTKYGDDGECENQKIE